MFVFYASLKPGAKKAIKRARPGAPYVGRKYVVEILGGKEYISTLNNPWKTGPAVVIHSSGPVIKEMR
jgi:hypothetical protein